jgi:hypothetical protein
MLKSLVTAAILAATIGSPIAAHANMQQVASAGYWAALAGSANDSGIPMCEIATHGDTFQFMLKYNKKGLYFNLWRQGWNIPKGVTAKVNMWVDSAPGWWINMTTTTLGDQGMLSGMIPSDARNNAGEPWGVYIMNVLRNGNAIHVRFPEGNTGNWDLSLNGTDTVMPPFVRCALAIDGNNTGQPYGQANNPGQPFGVTPKYQYQ